MPGAPARPRILLVTRNLPPLRGGMERLNLRMAETLADFSELTIIGPAGCKQFLPADVRVVEIAVQPLFGFLVRSLWAAWLRSAHPLDIALAGSGLTALSVILASRRAGAKSVAYLHGLDLLVRHPVYQLLWMPALRRLDWGIANSANTASIAKSKGVARGRITVIHPGVSLPHTDPQTSLEFRLKHNLGTRPVLLSVGRMTPRKGLPDFIRFAMPAIKRQWPDVVLVIIGDEAPDALSGSGRGSKTALEALASELELTENLLVLGPCSDDTLAQAYFAANVHVFPVREVPGDVEGFGMVAIEAAAHGLPTVAFAVGGIPDAVKSGESGYLVPPGDYVGFADRVCYLLMERKNLTESSRKMAEKFEWKIFGARLRDLMECIWKESAHAPE
jgi:phosphatidyl-myo-inositol dimannoside synthase